MPASPSAFRRHSEPLPISDLQYLHLTLPTPQQNLACDEALLELCEAGAGAELLRVWEPASYFVVLGYTNSIETEVNVPACRAQGVPILRRTSGGGTVLQGPGCLNYSLVLRAQGAALAGITETNAYIMQRQREALQTVVGAPIEVMGITDLVRYERKFSGNAQRRKRHFLLFHGTFLLDFDIARVQELLHPPARQPAYRSERSHAEFLTNLHAPAAAVELALKKEWRAAELFEAVPFQTIEQLAMEKYSSPEWIHKF